jgi:hypothetical protein
MRWVNLTLSLFLLGGCSTTPKYTSTFEQAHKQNLKQNADLLILEKDNTTLSMSIGDSMAPFESMYMEVVFDGTYLGFFPIRQEVFLPNFKGRKQVILIFSDSNGESMGITKSYVLTR